jgi:hypothetical protein
MSVGSEGKPKRKRNECKPHHRFLLFDECELGARSRYEVARYYEALNGSA